MPTPAEKRPETWNTTPDLRQPRIDGACAWDLASLLQES